MLNPAEYLRQVAEEVKRVTWPTRSETQQLTLLVVVVCGGIALYIGVIDYVFQRILSLFF